MTVVLIPSLLLGCRSTYDGSIQLEPTGESTNSGDPYAVLPDLNISP